MAQREALQGGPLPVISRVITYNFIYASPKHHFPPRVRSYVNSDAELTKKPVGKKTAVTSKGGGRGESSYRVNNVNMYLDVPLEVRIKGDRIIGVLPKRIESLVPKIWQMAN